MAALILFHKEEEIAAMAHIQSSGALDLNRSSTDNMLRNPFHSCVFDTDRKLWP